MTADQSVDTSSSTHADAAAAAIGHLREADKLLRDAFSHEHWHQPAGRLENISTQLRNLASVIEAMPVQEASRAEYAGRVREHYQNMRPLHDLPAGGQQLLQQELARTGA